ncbi:hypothetical protein YC2023_058463 [Brassica napus]
MSTFWSAKCGCDLQFLEKWTEGGLHRKHLGHDPSYSMRSQPNLSVYIMDQWLHNYLMIQVKAWGSANLVDNKDDALKTHSINLLNQRTIGGTFFDIYFNFSAGS